MVNKYPSDPIDTESSQLINLQDNYLSLPRIIGSIMSLIIRIFT